MIVCYDISDERRLRQVFKIMRGYGDWLQYSVFRCSLNSTEKYQLLEKLSGVIHFGDDQVMLVDLGGSSDFDESRIEMLGRPKQPRGRGPRVV